VISILEDGILFPPFLPLEQETPNITFKRTPKLSFLERPLLLRRTITVLLPLLLSLLIKTRRIVGQPHSSDRRGTSKKNQSRTSTNMFRLSPKLLPLEVLISPGLVYSKSFLLALLTSSPPLLSSFDH
jgi:hypothetical protein